MRMTDFPVTLPTPRNEQDLETMSKRLLKEHWGDTKVLPNGRRGQGQHGVDLFGSTLPDGRVKTAQCKLKNSRDKLTLAEIKDELKKTESFQPKIAEYIVITTSSRDAILQEEVRLLNVELSEERGFMVTVWGWEDVVEQLDEYPALRSKIYRSFIRGEEVADTDERPPPSLDDFRMLDLARANEDVLRAKDLLREGKPSQARLLLEEVRRRNWDQLGPQDRFRVLANLGRGFEAEGEYLKAADAYADAVAIDGNGQDAEILKIAMLAHRGNLEGARKVARSAAKKFPNASRVVAAKVRLNPEGASIEQLASDLPEELRDREGIALAVCCEAHAQGRPEFAEEWLRGRFERGLKSSSELDEELALALLARVANARRYVGDLNEQQSAALDEATNLLKKSLAEFGGNLPPMVEARLRENLGLAYRLAGDPESAVSELDRVMQIGGVSEQAAVRHATALYESGRQDTALRKLEEVAGHDASPRLRLLRARMLIDQGSDGQLEIARGLTQSVLANLGGLEVEEMHLALTQLIDFGEDDGLVGQIRRALKKPGVVEAPAYLKEAVLAAAHVEAGDCDEAGNHAMTAFSELMNFDVGDRVKSVEAHLVEILATLGMHEQVCRLLEGRVSRVSVGVWTARYLDACHKAGRDGEALALCEELRRGGEMTLMTCEIEAHLREKYGDLDGLLEVANAGLAAGFDEDFKKHLRIRKDTALIRRGDQDAVEARVDDYPSASSASESVAQRVVAVLVATGNHRKAREYAFERLRLQYHKAAAQSLYLDAMGFGSKHEAEVDRIEAVDEGAAVVLQLDGEDNERVFLIEAKGASGTFPWQVADMGHPILAAAIGLSAGEEFEYETEGLGKREGKVVSVDSKFIFALQAIIANWEVKFPEDRTLTGFRLPVDADGHPDIQGLQSVVQKQLAGVNQVLDIYREGRVSLGQVAARFGDTLFTATLKILFDSEQVLHAVDGETFSTVQPTAVLTGDCPLVASESTLALLYALRRTDLVATLGKRLVITEKAIESLRAFVEQQSGAGDQIKLGIGEQGLNAVVSSEEERKKVATQIEEFIESLEKNCTVVAPVALARIEAGMRERLVAAVGESEAGAIAIAIENDATLLTDEHGGGALMVSQFEGKRVWLQALIDELVASGEVEAEEAAEVGASLLAFDVRASKVTADIIVASLGASGWDVVKSPVRQILGRLGHPAIGSEALAGLLLGTIPSIWRKAPSPIHAGQVTDAIIAHTARRSDGRQVLLTMAAGMVQAFGLDPINGREVAGQCARTAALLGWLSSESLA